MSSDFATLYTPEGSGQQHVFYRDGQGDIRHVFYDMGSHARTSDSFPWATGAGVSNLAAMHTPGQQHIFYLGGAPNNFGFYQVFYDMTTGGPLHGPEQWVAAMPSLGGIIGELVAYPATMYTPDGQQHLFFVATDPSDGIYQVFYDPKRPNNPHRPSWQGGTPEQWVGGGEGQPVTMYTPNGQQHVFYRAGDSGIYQVFYDPNNPNNPNRPSDQGGSPEQWVV